VLACPSWSRPRRRSAHVEAFEVTGEQLDLADQVLLDPREVSPGVRVCVLEDTDGNPIGLRGT